MADSAPAFAYFYGLHKPDVYAMTLREWTTHYDWAVPLIRRISEGSN